MYTAQMGNPKFNGTCWVDLFNPEMVHQFFETCYKPYIKKYKKKTAHYIFSIFADEAHIHARYFDKKTPQLGVLSYSPWVRTKFKNLYGYDFIDKVNLLFEEKDNWREVRLQYYRAIALQFEESFSKQISNNCEKNGIKFTGHYLGEDILKKVRDRIGNSMLHYRNMQQPGIDNLGLTIYKRLITARSLSSVANQYGTPRRISEVFGISGQNMNFEDRKWIVGWNTILGVNAFCPHLTLYSLKGCRKRDYPPTFSYHQPYWQYNKKIEDYIGRLSYLTTIGQYQPQILIINPLESEYAKGKNDKEFSSEFLALMQNLQSAHYDYDLGDEQIINDTAFIKNNQLIIGSMSYANVILPNMITIRKTTLNLLLNLAKQGGKIINVGRFPEFVDGKPNKHDLDELKNVTISVQAQHVFNNLPSLIKPHVYITGNLSDKIWSQVRKTEKGYLLQLSNTSHTQKIHFNLKANFLDKNTVLWDPSTAKCFQLKPNKQGSFNLELPPSSNICITTNSLSNKAKIEGEYQLKATHIKIAELNQQWQGKKQTPNALTLDFAKYSIDHGKTFSKTEPVIGIYKRLSSKKYNGNLILEYPVQIQNIPKNCKLVVEDPDMFNTIQMNNKAVTFNKNDFFLDHSFPTATVNSLLKKNKNTIRFSLHFKPETPNSEKAKVRYGTEIESIYLIGDFAVQGNHLSTSMNSQRNSTGDFINRPVYSFNSFTITTEKSLFKGQLTIEGYPFFAGSFELKQTFNLDSINTNYNYFIDLPNCEDIVSKIEINGTNIGILTWTPYSAEITKALKQGNNEVKITLINSLRNLLGPHHQQRGELTRVGPSSFTGAGGFPDPHGEKNWYDLRKTNKKLKIWSDTYHHIPFGFLDPVTISYTKQ